MDTFSGRQSRPVTGQTNNVQPPAADEQPRQPVRTSYDRSALKKSGGKKKFYLVIAGILVLVALLVGVGVAVVNNLKSPLIDGGKYQALFLSNGQVYFGKLQRVDAEYYRLTDIFYLQAANAASDGKNPQETNSTSSDVQLIKLGSEVHGPEDSMVVDRAQVLFFENLKTDGKVAVSISQSHNQKKQ